ncbi:MAG: hypothetical protein ACYST5_20105, partial [Planctomycetota bacterium]
KTGSLPAGKQSSPQALPQEKQLPAANHIWSAESSYKKLKINPKTIELNKLTLFRRTVKAVRDFFSAKAANASP